MPGKVVAVSRGAKNDFSKPEQTSITLIAGLGVDGDAHAGKTVQHLYLKKKNPDVPNLRQVHLVQAELFGDLAGRGYKIGPGNIGENITTEGIALPELPVGTELRIGDTRIGITGLRTPCGQIDGFRKGLTKAVTEKNADGRAYLRFGVMGVVIAGGQIKPGDEISVELPPLPHTRLQPV